MSGSLHSGLDGPKWAPVGNHRPRSQSRAPLDDTSILTAPRKPPASELSEDRQALLAGSVKKLFPSPTESLPGSSASFSDSVATGSDVGDTPRPVRATPLDSDADPALPTGRVASLGDSFLRDFVPRLPPRGLFKTSLVWLALLLLEQLGLLRLPYSLTPLWLIPFLQLPA